MPELLALSPGPFHSDGIALAKGSEVNFFLKIRHVSSGRSPDRSWRLKCRVEALQFSPNGRRLAAGLFKNETILVLSLESDSILEFVEPISGSGLVQMRWDLDDWLITFADFGLHMSLWHPHKSETEPDRISKPNRSPDDLTRFVVDMYSSKFDGDFVAVNHGVADVSIFRCETWEKRWDNFAIWTLETGEYIDRLQFLDQTALIISTDPLRSSGALYLVETTEGALIKQFNMNNPIGGFSYEATSRRLTYWGLENGLNFTKAMTRAEEDNDFADPDLCVWTCKFNAGGDRVAVLLRDPHSPDEQSYLVLRKQLNQDDEPDEGVDLSLAVQLSEFIMFVWDPTLRDRLVVVLKKVVLLWNRDRAPEIISNITAEERNKVHKNVLWNSTGSLLIIQFESPSEFPLFVDVYG